MVNLLVPDLIFMFIHRNKKMMNFFHLIPLFREAPEGGSFSVVNGYHYHPHTGQLVAHLGHGVPVTANAMGEDDYWPARSYMWFNRCSLAYWDGEVLS